MSVYRELTDQEVETACNVCGDEGLGKMIVVDLAREVRAQRQRNGTWKLHHQAPIEDISRFVIERTIPRDQRQAMIASWAEMAFGREEATSIPQRGLRLLEEASEAFQVCGGDEAIAHKLVTYVFGRPPGAIGQELGGVAVTTLALAAAAGVSADEEECREINRVLSKPLREFAQRNASKNAAGFKIDAPGVLLPRNACCGSVGTYNENGHDCCLACGRALGMRVPK